MENIQNETEYIADFSKIEGICNNLLGSVSEMEAGEVAMAMALAIGRVIAAKETSVEAEAQFVSELLEYAQLYWAPVPQSLN